MAEYSEEQLRRKAWIEQYGSPAGYKEAMKELIERTKNETNNN